MCVNVYVKAVQTFTLHTASAINNRKTIKFAISQMESGTRNGSEELLPAHVKCMRWPNKAQATTTTTKHNKTKQKPKEKFKSYASCLCTLCIPCKYPALQHFSWKIKHLSLVWILLILNAALKFLPFSLKVFRSVSFLQG